MAAREDGGPPAAAWSPTWCRGRRRRRAPATARPSTSSSGRRSTRDLRPGRAAGGRRRRPSTSRAGTAATPASRSPPARCASGWTAPSGACSRCRTAGCWRWAAAPGSSCSASPPRRSATAAPTSRPWRWRRSAPSSTGAACRRSSWPRGSPTTGPASRPGRVRPRRPQLGRPVLPRRGLPGARCWRARSRRWRPAARSSSATCAACRCSRPSTPRCSSTAPRARCRRPSWRGGCGRGVADEEELVVDPDLFLALARRLPAVRRVQVLLKRGRHANELTRFRYDVVLHVGRRRRRARDEPRSHAWESLGGLERLLAERPAALAVSGIPNARLAGEVAALELLAGRRGWRPPGSCAPRSNGAPRTGGRSRGSLGAGRPPGLRRRPDLVRRGRGGRPLRRRACGGAGRASRPG